MLSNMKETKQQKGYKFGAGKYQQTQFNKRKQEYASNPQKCLHCETPLPYPYRGAKKKFCNRSCAASYNNKQRLPYSKEYDKTKDILQKPKKILCLRCNDNVEVFNRRISGIVCEKCKQKEQREQKSIKKHCKGCNKLFTPNRKSHRYCSRKCVYKDPDIIKRISQGGRNSAAVQSKKRRSKNEKLFAKLCTSQFKNVLFNEPIFNGWDADVIIEEIKMAILWNGRWHYEKITEKHSVKQVQNRDKIKIKEINNAGYTHYIIKDMGSYNPDFVKEQFKEFLRSIQLVK